MFELSDFYGYCQENHVDVIPYCGCPQPGATVRDREDYAIFLDFTKISSTRLLRGVCYHELGHAATGALHKVSSPYELVERSEHRANRWAAQHYLTEKNSGKRFPMAILSLGSWQSILTFLSGRSKAPITTGPFAVAWILTNKPRCDEHIGVSLIQRSLRTDL